MTDVDENQTAVQVQMQNRNSSRRKKRLLRLPRQPACPCNERTSGRGVIGGLWAGESGGRLLALGAHHSGGCGLIFLIVGWTLTICL